MISSEDVDEKLYITPVGCHGILRRGGSKVNPRLAEVLKSISDTMSEDEIEARSRRQPRGAESGMAKLTRKMKNADEAN